MRRRRGIALLLVLGTLVLVVSTLGLLSLASAQTHRAASVSVREQTASDLLYAAEPLVRQWLADQAPRAVVPPDAIEPKILVAEIRWTEFGRDGSLRIAAWDLLGMIPARTPPASPLWLSVGDGLRDRDYANMSTLLDIPDSPRHPSVTESTTAVGGQIAIIPKLPRRSAATISSPININTAPRPLLEAALTLAQRGDLAAIITARAEDRPSPAPPPHSGRSQQKPLVGLTGRSTLWAVRVDAEIHDVKRSWWTVYESRSNDWEIIERHAISE
ncbi:MAG TPA: hypothetical protein ENJ00_07945 [Phycisphaerales bacterium]|nr:hypothetical protein [Phycisphaerales bacterium]